MFTEKYQRFVVYANSDRPVLVHLFYLEKHNRIELSQGRKNHVKMAVCISGSRFCELIPKRSKERPNELFVTLK